METFKLIQPSAALTPFIKHYWILRINLNTPVTERIIPVGCIHLTFHREKQLYSLTEKQLQPKAFICGQSDFYSDIVSTGCLNMLVVVFQPHAPKVFFEMPVNKFYGMNISVDDLDDLALSDLQKQIMDTPDDTQCVRLIESFLFKRLFSIPEYNLRRVHATIQKIDLCPHPTITGLAQTACLSNKQFNRIFTEYIGTTPKEYIRIIRLQRALHVLETQPDINFSQLACECGYYDQSHLIKEFKAFSGYTPGEYITICAPHSDYFSER